MAYKGLSGLTDKSEHSEYPNQFNVNGEFVFSFTDEAMSCLNKKAGKILIAIEGYGKFWFYFDER